MPTLVNNLRAIRGPVTAVPMVGASGVVVEPDTVNNQVVVRADETVLWEGEGTTAGCTFSESKDNFERLKVYCYANEQTSSKQQIIEVPASNNALPLCLWYANGGSGAYPYVVYRTYYRLNSTEILPNEGTATGGHVWFSASWGVGGSDNVATVKITKVVGINRKST